MIKQTLFFSTFMLLVITTACKQRSKLKVDEDEIREELKAIEPVITEQQEAIVGGFKGIRLPENRTIETNLKPIVIDIEGSLNNIKELKLSDVATTIQYIRLQPLDNKELRTDMKYRFSLTDNYIVAANLFGIHLFNIDGSYNNTLVRNRLDGISYDEKRGSVLIFNDHTRIGGDMNIWTRGDRVYYVYTNSITGQKSIMEYDCVSPQLLTSSEFDVENQQKILAKGTVSVDLMHGNNKPYNPKNKNGMMSMSPESLYEHIGIFSDDKGNYIKRQSGDNMLFTFNSNGDTLCSFTKYERLQSYTKNLVRGTDGGSTYTIANKLYIRPSFNDTLFQVIPPNKLLPKYVFKLGKYKMDIMEGSDPDVSLQGKIVPMSWAETANYAFLTFSKDNYASPRNRRNKSVNIYQAVYSKQNKELYIIKGDPTNYEPKILLNDIDGGPSVWPLDYMISNDHSMLMALKGYELIKHIKSSEFINSTDSDKKQNLIQFCQTLKADDDVLMIVK
ncbi:DUF4933 domain-containing protein [Carboxylicivirga sp. N1Y90]|uniref:DUF4933 domain-containing protein n=1 Tax=Carboxylicivirga fragile TaxID=3417571 RepID=UPI003D33E2AF|nr:DUF4933 domain-containing protein [Marinilabiliaceae bacterium N1Y90]